MLEDETDETLGGDRRLDYLFSAEYTELFKSYTVIRFDFDF